MAKSIRCRGAVCWSPGSPIVLEELEVAAPTSGQVRIKIVANSLCHTDFTWLRSSEVPLGGWPLVLGHEATGIVESTGPDVANIKPGDHVIVLWVSNCGECYHCKKGNNLCTLNTTFRPQDLESSCFMAKGEKLHYMMVGTLAGKLR